MPKKYPKTVAAALAETKNKFELAAALAREVPPRKAGRLAGDDDTVAIKPLLEDVRAAIVAAGGEPKSVDTLARYRKTALWANWAGSSPIPGVSFTAHDEARMAGVSYATFAANPKPFRETRLDAGKALPGGENQIDLKAVAENLTAEQAKALAADLNPAAAAAVAEEVLDRDEVRQQPGVRGAMASASLRNESEGKRRKEQKTAGNPVSKKLDETTALLDLDRCLTAFIRDAESIFPRLPASEGPNTTFLVRTTERAKEVMDRIVEYVETGRTDIDAFLSTVLKGD